MNPFFISRCHRPTYGRMERSLREVRRLNLIKIAY